MSAPNRVTHVTVPLSGTITEAFNIGNARAIGIHIPVITSANVGLDVSWDTTSANFSPLHDPRSDVQMAVPGSAGNRAITIVGLEPWAYAKVTLSSAQAAVRSLAIIGKS